MKKSFFKYFFILFVLLFAVQNNYAATLRLGQNSGKETYLKSFVHKNVQTATIKNNLRKVASLHSDKIQHTLVQHYKADFHENEFEVQNSSKNQRIKALFKAIVLFFAIHLSIHYHSTKSTTVLATLTTFFSYLKSKSFLSLRVIRL